MKNVVIIGAGPAGLTAALELLRTPEAYRVIVLEESDQIGGISRTVCHNGNRMDIGGHRFFSKDERVNAWWADVFPLQGKPAKDDIVTGREVPLASGGPDPEREDEVMLSRRRVSRIYYGHRFFDYPIRMNLSTIRNMGFVTTFKAGVSYLLSCAHKLPETSLENFYINRFGRKLYAMFFRGYTQKLWGRKPSKQKRSQGKPDDTRAGTKAVAPGRHCTSMPLRTHSRTTRKPGSEMPGVPASDTKATVSPAFSLLITLSTVLCSLNL